MSTIIVEAARERTDDAYGGMAFVCICCACLTFACPTFARPIQWVAVQLRNPRWHK
jgi:hypothetical protein